MLKYCDSFDHYTSLLSKWTQIFAASISGAAGRNGNGLLLSGGGSVLKTLGLQSAFVIGFAYRINTTGTPSGTPYILSAVNTSRGLATVCQLSILPDNTLAMYAGNSVLIFNPKTFVFSIGTWNYIELTINLTAGGGGNVNVAAVLHVNGQSIASGNADAALATTFLLSNSNQANVHSFSACVVTGSCNIDDIYICDQSGGVNNTFLGDVKIGCIFPRQDVTTQWTPSSGMAHFSLVNEHVPDDDTTYVYDNNIGDKDTYYFDNVSAFSGQIQGAQLCIYARKNDEGSRALRDIANAGAFVGANDIYLGDTYSYHTVPYDTNPAGGGAFTPANINATDFGVKLTV